MTKSSPKTKRSRRSKRKVELDLIRDRNLARYKKEGKHIDKASYDRGFFNKQFKE